MKFSPGRLERQARCEHSQLRKERIMGQQTGDLVCAACGEVFFPDEKVVPVNYRAQMIVSSHALLVALRVNRELVLVKNFVTPLGLNMEYDWALVNKENREFVISVAADVAEECLSEGYVSLEE
jgi:hypothetical protein